jgi:hypothetical protein
MNVNQEIFKVNVKKELDVVLSTLVRKNKDYGDAAMNPVRIFSEVDAKTGLLVRIDDKLSRIKSVGLTNATEDSVLDLIGYLVLLKIKIKEETMNQDAILW